jgi:hypothetical protein
MELKINYFRLILPIGLFILATPLVLSDYNISVIYWILFALLVYAVFGVIWFLSSPLVWIRIDSENNVLVYQTLLKEPITANLSSANSQITTRQGGGQNFRITELILYVEKQKVATAQVPAWPIDRLKELNKLINH